MTLMYRYLTLQLLLPEPDDAPLHLRTLLQLTPQERIRMLQLLILHTLLWETRVASLVKAPRILWMQLLKAVMSKKRTTPPILLMLRASREI